MSQKRCDIVLEGGGVKGIALAGALLRLYQAGYDQCRIAGTSAGAIVGAFVAAGMPIPQLVKLMEGLDYTQFQDESLLDTLGVPGKTASLVFEKGIYEGKYLHSFIEKELGTLGVETFGDLKITDAWAQKLPPEQRYKLVVIVSDVSRGRMVRLPWDYKDYGLDPDAQSVAQAVRASMSIPFFYEPVKLQKHYLVDGGLLSNFPIGLFDTSDSWPTFGIKLSARSEALTKTNPVSNPIDYSLAILSTAMNAHDRMHIDDPCTQMRTIFVDTFDVKATDFAISKEMQRKLFESGQKYAERFLKSWDFAAYQQKCGIK